MKLGELLVATMTQRSCRDAVRHSECWWLVIALLCMISESLLRSCVGVLPIDQAGGFAGPFIGEKWDLVSSF